MKKINLNNLKNEGKTFFAVVDTARQFPFKKTLYKTNKLNKAYKFYNKKIHHDVDVKIFEYKLIKNESMFGPQLKAVEVATW